MGPLSRLSLLFLLLGSTAWAQQPQPPYPPDEDDEAALAAQQAQQQAYQQQQQPYQQQDPNAYPPADPYAQQGGDPYAGQQQQQQPQAMQYAFMGSHPIPYDAGGGYCYQTGAHYHEYPPFDQNLFRESNGYYYFVGDPGDFGYSQQMWGYNGNHPIPMNAGGGYCYITWPHRHPYAPPASMYYNLVGGYYAYNGPWDPLYWRYRDRYASYYGNYYRSNYYGGRYWTVRPPHIYRPSLTIGAPGVRVYTPGVRGGGVVVGAPGIHVYAPAPRGFAPAPHVYSPGVHVYAPAPRVYAPAPRVYAPAAPQHYSAPAPAHISAPAARPSYSRPASSGGGHHR